MRKLWIALAWLVLLAGVARCEEPMHITNWWANYVFVASTNTTTGDTGLPASTDYVCFPLADIDHLTAVTASNTNTSSDVRALIFALTKEFYDVYNGKGTNKPSRLTITETVSTSANGDVKYGHRVQTELDVTTISVTSE